MLTFGPLNFLFPPILLIQAERIGLRNRIDKKAAYLQDLEEQVRVAFFIFLLVDLYSSFVIAYLGPCFCV